MLLSHANDLDLNVSSSLVLIGRFVVDSLIFSPFSVCIALGTDFIKYEFSSIDYEHL